MEELQGRTALVTGASRGIGSEIAVSLPARDARGRSLQREPDAAEETLAQMPPSVSGAHLLVQGRRRAAGRIHRHGGADGHRIRCLDVLVNNAGIFEAVPFDTPDYEIGRRAGNVRWTSI